MSETCVTPAVVVRWAHECDRALAAARTRLDEANVFPVADSDTGTNLWLTVHDGVARLDEARPRALASEANAGAVLTLRAFARGALDGARGNSGAILGEYLRGFVAGCVLAAGGAQAVSGIDGAVVRAALETAARRAYAAVGRPAAGTILTAAAEAARAAQQAGPDLDAVVVAAVEGARRAVGHSPAELATLREAHVVDAGALGLLVVLEALQAAVEGTQGHPLTPLAVRAEEWDDDAGAVSFSHQHAHGGEADDPAACAGGGGGLEIMFAARHLPAGADPGREVASLRSRLLAVADSVVVVDDDPDDDDPDDGEPGRDDGTAGVAASPAADRVRVHVHTDDPVEVVAAADGWTVERAVVHHLARSRTRAWAVVGVTRSPGLLAHVARTAAVALWAQDGRVRDDDLERALVDAHAPTVVLALGRTAHDPALVERAVRIGERAGVTVRAVVPQHASSDAHLLAALAAAEMADAVLDDPAAAARSVVAAVRGVRGTAVDAAEPEGAPPVVAAARTLLGPGAEVLTAVLDRDVPEAVADAVAQAATQAGAEPVVVRSGLAGTRCVLGAEPGSVVEA